MTRTRRIEYPPNGAHPDGSWRVIRYPDDDGVFGDNYPYTSEAHAPLTRTERRLIIAGVSLILFGCYCLAWWPW